MKLTREQVAKGLECFLDLAKHWGLSPDKPEDGWKMAFKLFMDQLIQDVERLNKNKGPGVKAHKGVEDAILMIGVDYFRRKGDRRGESKIIEELAKMQGWPAHEKAVESRRRRYQDLKKQDPEKSREFRNMLTVWPQVGDRLAELAARKK